MRRVELARVLRILRLQRFATFLTDLLVKLDRPGVHVDQRHILLRRQLADAPEESDAQQQLGLRGASIQELRARGVEYILMYDFDFRANDFNEKYRVWGMTLLGEHNGARLFRLNSPEPELAARQ